jgi:hypothetical protein
MATRCCRMANTRQLFVDCFVALIITVIHYLGITASCASQLVDSLHYYYQLPFCIICFRLLIALFCAEFDLD